MTNLSNKVEYSNPLFPAAYAEYLIVNGYSCSAIKNDLYFVNDTKQLIVRNDNIDLFHFVPEVPEHELEKWVFEQNHSGISNLNIIKWMQLLDCMGVISLDQFLKSAKLIGEQAHTEAEFLIKEFLKQIPKSLAI